MGQLCSYLIKRKCVLTIFFLSHMEKVRQQWQVASIENDESKKRFLFFKTKSTDQIKRSTLFISLFLIFELS